MRLRRNMHDDSIVGRTQKLHHDMELLLEMSGAIGGVALIRCQKTEHDKRTARLVTFVKNSGRLSKKPTDNRATDRSGTVELCHLPEAWRATGCHRCFPLDLHPIFSNK
jgi:hypothetical protein